MTGIDAAGLLAHLFISVGSTSYIGYVIARWMPTWPGVALATVVAIAVGGSLALGAMFALLYAIEAFKDGPWNAGQTTTRMLQIVLLCVLAAPLGAYRGRKSKATTPRSEA